MFTIGFLIPENLYWRYVIKECVTVAAILNINSIMFNIYMKTCCLAYIVFSIRFLVYENL